MQKRGFTLIEVLVVLMIMGLLVGTAVINFGAGLQASKLRDANRTVYQYVRHARAVALLKQRPVVLRIEEIAENGEFVKSRVSIDFSQDAAQEQSVTPLGQGFMSGSGEVQTLSMNPESPAEDASVAAEPAGDAAAAPEKDPLSAPPREFEGIHVRGALQEDRTERRARLSVFSNVDVLTRKFTAEKEKADARRTDSATPAGASDDASEEAKDEDQVFEVVYEANGRCTPYEVRLWCEGDDENEAQTIKLGRFGRPVTND